MKRSHLFLFLAVSCLATFYAWSKVHKLQTIEREYQEARYFPELEQSAVGRIKVVSLDPSFEYELVRNGDVWYIDGHLLSHEHSYQLVSSVLELSKERQMVASPSAEDEAEFRLDSPSYRLTIWDNEDEQIGEIKLGKRTPDYNHFYGQSQEGGEISTVPAYTLGVLEKEPKELREMSLLPVELATVNSLWIVSKDQEIELERRDESDFVFVKPEEKGADETAVEAFLTRLNQRGVGRFLSKDEETETGEVEVSYRAKLSYSELQWVTELHQRVSVQPKLLYGRRYLFDPEKQAQVPGTEERFVVEISPNSDFVNPTPRLFEERRVVVFDMDKLKGLSVSEGGLSVAAQKDASGSWKVDNKSESADAISALIFTLKDLRFEEDIEGTEPSPDEETSIELSGIDKNDVVLRFSKLENGNPYLWRDGKAYLLSDGTWDKLSEATTKVLRQRDE